MWYTKTMQEQDISSESLLLPAAKDLVQLISDLDSALIWLSEKRVTLEEKMIRTYLVELSLSLLDLSKCLHSQVLLPNQNPSESPLAEVRTLLSEMQPVFAELLKAIAHSANYLEQYFEYDFYNRLKYEKRFLERAQELAKKHTRPIS